MRRVAWLFLCACGASEPQTVTVAPLPATPSASTSASATAPALSATNGPHCPASFSLQQGSCHGGDAECTYPEGRCFCTDFPHCGGAMPKPWTPGSPGRLVCEPSDPHAVRADGCLFGPPTAGAACDKPNQSCVYGDCAWSAATYTCKGGRWDLHQYHGPPPP